jgi:hypothetical protein
VAERFQRAVGRQLRLTHRMKGVDAVPSAARESTWRLITGL